MVAASIQKYLNQFLSEKRGQQIHSMRFHAIGGGCINSCFKITINNNESFFLKVNSKTIYPSLFEKEKNGLSFLSSQGIIKVPGVIICDEIDDYQFLVLSWIESGLKTAAFWKQFGEQLARLHDVTNPFFGFEENNYMGSLPQNNSPHKMWAEFFIHCRLQPQVKMAMEKNLLTVKHVACFEELYPQLTSIFNDEPPSLLHGDLWSGNFMCDHNTTPVLIDPAVYFGHRSMDLAMAKLFGGFDRNFYEAYQYYHPLAHNHEEQEEISNLYPLLIHLNLFGSGYLGQVERTLYRFVERPG
jgi:protein-ribulosamine 3-kinase